MNAPFLCGIFVAWTMAQVAFGVFFILAYVLRRREVEYLLFSLVCFALALDTAGIAFGYYVTDVRQWPLAAMIAHLGAIPAAAINLHFVMSFARVPIHRQVIVPLYGLAGFYMALNAFGGWWSSSELTVKASNLWGSTVEHVTASPSLLATSFYVVALVQVSLSLVLLVRSYRRGRREVGIAIGAAGIIALTVLNDVLLVTGVIESVYAAPHGFIIYAFAVGSTLLFRYRSTAGELEATVVDLEEATEELRSSYAELRVVQDELGRKRQLAAVGELAAMIAHEVRNPLAVIMNAIASFRRPGLKEEDRDMLLGIVEEETARLNRLVTDLLRFARPVNVKRSPVSLPELAKRASTMVDVQHAVEVDIDDDPDIQTVSADPGLLRLVFDNLISNACQAMPNGGTVRVTVKRATRDGVEGVSINIHDTGEGMEEDVLSRAPDPFFTTRPSGTGLGLPIVERIMEAHDGSISIDSEAGEGTVVRLFIALLPAKVAVADSRRLPERRTA